MQTFVYTAAHVQHLFLTTPLILEMVACCMFALNAQYLLHSSRYAQAFFFVRDGPKLMAFGMMDFRTIKLPDGLEANWDGKGRLIKTLPGITSKVQCVPQIVAHIPAIASCATADKGTGAKLLKRMMSCAMYNGCSFLIIEALKPLDKIYYPQYHFACTTLLESKDNLQPMIVKLSNLTFGDDFKVLDVPIDKRPLMLPELLAAPDFNKFCVATTDGFLSFLMSKGHVAQEMLRRICVRMSLVVEDWSGGHTPFGPRHVARSAQFWSHHHDGATLLTDIDLTQVSPRPVFAEYVVRAAAAEPAALGLDAAAAANIDAAAQGAAYNVLQLLAAPLTAAPPAAPPAEAPLTAEEQEERDYEIQTTGGYYDRSGAFVFLGAAAAAAPSAPAAPIVTPSNRVPKRKRDASGGAAASGGAGGAASAGGARPKTDFTEPVDYVYDGSGCPPLAPKPDGVRGLRYLAEAWSMLGPDDFVKPQVVSEAIRRNHLAGIMAKLRSAAPGAFGRPPVGGGKGTGARCAEDLKPHVLTHLRAAAANGVSGSDIMSAIAAERWWTKRHPLYLI